MKGKRGLRAVNGGKTWKCDGREIGNVGTFMWYIFTRRGALQPQGVFSLLTNVSKRPGKRFVWVVDGKMYYRGFATKGAGGPGKTLRSEEQTTVIQWKMHICFITGGAKVKTPGRGVWGESGFWTAPEPLSEKNALGVVKNRNLPRFPTPWGAPQTQQVDTIKKLSMLAAGKKK